MQHLVTSQNLGEVIRIDSAGTSSYHIGEPADRRMREAAKQRGYDLTSRSRQVSARDLREFDLIIAMDRNNFREVSALGQEPISNVRMLADYLDSTWPREVPDPYYGGEDGFHRVIDMLEAACPQILAELLTAPPSEKNGAELG